MNFHVLNRLITKISFILLLSLASFSMKAQQSIFEQMNEAYDQGDFELVLQLKDEASTELASAPDSVIAEFHSLIGGAHIFLNSFENAEDAYLQEKIYRVRAGQTDSESFSTLLFNLTYLYDQLGRYAEAESVGKQLLALDEKIFGSSSDEYVQSVLFYADVVIKLQRHDDVINLLSKTMRSLDKENYLYPYLLNKEADVHTLLGHYSKAERKMIESVKLIEQNEGRGSVAFANATANLGYFYSSIGKYPQAEELLLYSRDILKGSEENRDFYISALNNLAIVHYNLNQQEKALEEFSTVLEHDIAIYGEDNISTAQSLVNVGSVYNALQKYEKAEEVFLKALEIIEAQEGKNSTVYALNANNLAYMYRLAGEPEKSIPLYKNALNIYEAVYGKKDPYYINSLYNLGTAYYSLENEAAEDHLKKSLKNRKKIFNTAHPKYAESAERLAYWYWSINEQKKTEKYFEELFENYYIQIEKYFPALSEEEKVNFFINKLKLSFEAFDNYALENHEQNPELLEIMLDNQLNTKALIMYATNKVRESIMSSGDQELIEQYQTWLGVKEQLSRLFSSQKPENEQTIDSLNTIAEMLEKDLGRKSSSFTKTYLKKKVSWKDVQQTLQPNEAVIEILRFREFDPARGGEFTDSINYVALLFTKESENPKLIKIPHGDLLENRYINNYRNAIQFKIQDEYSYDKLWRPIGEHLNNIKRIYFSPDGVYNQISINTLYNPQTGNYLLDEIEIRVLTNSKDLLDPQLNKNDDAKAYLLGYPNYNMDVTNNNKAETRGGMRGGSATEGLTRGLTRGMRAGLLRYMRGEEGIAMLPGTKEEVENIGNLYEGTEIQPETVLNNDATEHFIKSVRNPKTLHIATHGFFLPDVDTDLRGEENKYIENPLLRSGLILAGAGDFLLTGQPIDSTLQDGILTAYEAMNLNLDQTELVVLSACETGLGEIKNGEGVYGLQRAFLIAGADNVIMSMWSVDDEATQELMSIFYKEWIESGNKQDAFRKAQQELKKKYKDPFYWGAFIMVGI